MPHPGHETRAPQEPPVPQGSGGWITGHVLRLQGTTQSRDIGLSPQTQGAWGPAGSGHKRVLGPCPSSVLRALNLPTRASLKPQQQRQRPPETPWASPGQKQKPGGQGAAGGELPTNLIPSHPGVTRGGVSLATLLFRLGADCPPAGPRRGTGGPLPTPPGHASRSPRHVTLTPASLGQASPGSHEAEGGSGCGWGRARAVTVLASRPHLSAPTRDGASARGLACKPGRGTPRPRQGAWAR